MEDLARCRCGSVLFRGRLSTIDPSTEPRAAHRCLGPIDGEVLGARLREQSQIDDPSAGPAEPLEVEARGRLWPHASQWALIELTEVSSSGARRLEEYRFVPAREAQGVPPFVGSGVPVAILFERSPNGLSRARIYSVEELAPERAAPLPADMRLKLTRPDDVVTRYFAALQAADVTAALACFEPQGYLQTAQGERFIGRERLRLPLSRWFRRGGMTVRYCERFDDGARTVLELLLPDAVPALWVCERGRSRALAGVRIYR
jgi:hypothetical protein